MCVCVGGAVARGGEVARGVRLGAEHRLHVAFVSAAKSLPPPLMSDPDAGLPTSDSDAGLPTS